MKRPAKSTASWEAASQRHLTAALALVRAALEARAGNAAPTKPATLALRREMDAAVEALPAPSTLQRLCSGFNLSEFERDVVLLCAGCELDSKFPALCAAASGEARRLQPTFSLALAALPGAHWSACAPQAALRNWRLIEVGAGDTLTGSPLRLDERVLHFLCGIGGSDARLRGLFLDVAPPDELPPSHAQRAAQLVALWRAAQEQGNFPAVQLVARESGAPTLLAAAAAAAFGVRLQAARAADLPAPAAERETLIRLWEREAILARQALLIDVTGDASPEATRGASAFAESARGIVLIVGETPLRLRTRALARIDLPPPTPAEQRLVWRQALGPVADSLNGQVELVSSQFQLDLSGIYAASAEVLQRHAAAKGADVATALWDACRTQTRPRVHGLARRIATLATWNEVVLPAPQRGVLRTIAAHVRQRACVYDGWGFARKSDRGLGIAVLFAGGTGTGKTMAAEALANELRLDLYRVDLSALVDKYIGETEKNLRQVFDAAEAGGAILLFDEADAIFGRRSEVRDSHDRYANIEVGYLLQRIEAYRGLVILTTNQAQSIDPAFSRRIRFTVHFPFPDLAQRAEIWRRVFPAATPTEGLKVEKLARLSLAGGHIRNLALNAAFLAADAREPVRMKHLLVAAQSEFAKMEKPLSEAETAGWV